MNMLFGANNKLKVTAYFLKSLGVLLATCWVSWDAQAYEPCTEDEVLGVGYACEHGRIIEVGPETAADVDAPGANSMTCEGAILDLSTNCSDDAGSRSASAAQNSYQELMMMQSMMGGAENSDMLNGAMMAYMGIQTGHDQTSAYVERCEARVEACRSLCTQSPGVETCGTYEQKVAEAKNQKINLAGLLPGAMMAIQSLMAQRQSMDKGPNTSKYDCKKEMAAIGVSPEHIKQMCEPMTSQDRETASTTEETPRNSSSDPTGLGISEDFDEFDGTGEGPSGGNNQVEQLSAAGGAGGGMMGSAGGGSGAANSGKEKSYSIDGSGGGYNTDILRGLSSASGGRQGARGARSGARAPASARTAGPRSGAVHPLALNQRGKSGSISAFQPQAQEIRPRDSDSLFDRTHKVLYKEKYLMQGDFLN